MTLLEFLILILVAGLIGAIGRALAGSVRGGFLMSVAVGFIGALVGTFLARQLGLPDLFALKIGGTTLPIVWSIIGGALFVAILALLTRRNTIAVI